ncbi:hypothetical protein ACYSNU_11625 [Enterococcus sp. LJL120]
MAKRGKTSIEERMAAGKVDMLKAGLQKIKLYMVMYMENDMMK